MYTKLNFSDEIEHRTKELLSGDFRINNGGKLIAKNPSGILGSPWVFINYGRRKYCGLWNAIYCGYYRLIPTFCRFQCWKTVIYPENVKETFECYDIMRLLDLPSKIGADLRKYTYAAWGGYVYGDSLEEGRRYWKTVREAIPGQIPVILKRGCTEMERLKPSSTWDSISEYEVRQEERLNDMFDFSEFHFFQSNWQKSLIKEDWVKRAIMIKDPTARETAEKYSNDPDIWKKLVVHSEHYHEKDPRIIVEAENG